MIYVKDITPGTSFRYKNEPFVRCSPLIYRRPIDSDRKGKQVLAISTLTGKELLDNVEIDTQHLRRFKIEHTNKR